MRRERWKQDKVIACALASWIAYVTARDQSTYGPTRWTAEED